MVTSALVVGVFLMRLNARALFECVRDVCAYDVSHTGFVSLDLDLGIAFRNRVDTLTATNAANVNTNTLVRNVFLACNCMRVRVHTWRVRSGR
jgi:hypothetical protein